VADGICCNCMEFNLIEARFGFGYKLGLIKFRQEQPCCWSRKFNYKGMEGLNLGS
jgi:hypothetical protein